MKEIATGSGEFFKWQVLCAVKHAILYVNQHLLRILNILYFFQIFLQEFKEFCPNEQFVKGTLCLDICAWDPSYSKTQVSLYSKLLSKAYAQLAIFVLIPLFFSPDVM